jgi:hypothetical protein
MSPPSPVDDRDRVDDPEGIEEFDPPTDGDGKPPARGGGEANPGAESGHGAGATPDAPMTTTESVRRTLDRYLPAAGVDSDWWYWIAAVPLYFLVTLVGGVVAGVVFLFAGVLDVVGFGGVASFSTFVLFAGVAALFGLVGVALAVVFPVALYVDARAIEELDGEWTPDPVLWGLFGVVAVLVTNFVLSVPLALYYLYRRHAAVGTP